MKMAIEKTKIRAILGDEPRRDGEYPMAHIVGFDGVTRIDEDTENLGHYGIHWFFVYAGDELRFRINALSVASVELFKADA
jgi:hypothetical protein